MEGSSNRLQVLSCFHDYNMRKDAVVPIYEAPKLVCGKKSNCPPALVKSWAGLSPSQQAGSMAISPTGDNITRQVLDVAGQTVTLC